MRGVYSLAEAQRENAKIILKYSTAFPFKNTNHSFCCTFCDDQFPEPISWRAHMLKEHKTYNFYNVFHRQNYIKIDIKNLACRICSKKFNGIDDLLTHLKSDHQKPVNFDKPLGVIPFKLDPNNWECVFCNEKFNFYRELRDHTIKHINNYVCHLCGSGFLVSKELKNHIDEIHKGKSRKFRCKTCLKIFDSRKDMESHRKSEHWNCYKCIICKSKPVFKNWDHRYKHMTEVHGWKTRNYDCHICNETFTTRTTRYNHMVKTHTEKKFECSYCKIAFHTKPQLKNHEVKHTDVRPFKCSVCSKDFSRKRALNMHMRIHTNDRRFICKECGQSFIQGTSLKLHVRTHHPHLVK